MGGRSILPTILPESKPLFWTKNRQTIVGAVDQSGRLETPSGLQEMPTFTSFDRSARKPRSHDTPRHFSLSRRATRRHLGWLQMGVSYRAAIRQQ
ncbi:hypothetical protein TorRG33x02_308300, partial [Trema orientale]